MFAIKRYGQRKLNSLACERRDGFRLPRRERHARLAYWSFDDAFFDAFTFKFLISRSSEFGCIPSDFAASR